MGAIFGHLNISDTDRVFQATVGQQVIYEAAVAFIERINAELAAAMQVFVERMTSDFKLRYKLPGGGYLQRRGPDGRYGTVKATGQWDVALPLEDFGAMIAGNDVDMAYMTVAELERHISTIVAQNVNTTRFEALLKLFKNTNTTFIDPLHGSLTVVPLANGDTVVYPPVIGSATEATDDHYIETNYAEADISDTNDPFEVIVPELEEHFGMPTGGSNIVTFINDSARPEVQGLTDFFDVEDAFIRSGANADVPIMLPSVPGRIIGRHKAGSWVSVWNHVPSNYSLSVHLEAAPPLIERVDPADTGLGQGLQLVSTNQEFPFEESVWRNRFGLGVGNRLNGVVLEFGTGGTYDIPTAFQ